MSARNDGKVTVVFKRVPSSDSGGEDALNRIVSLLQGAGAECDENDDVVSIRNSDRHGPATNIFDITLRVGGI